MEANGEAWNLTPAFQRRPLPLTDIRQVAAILFAIANVTNSPFNCHLILFGLVIDCKLLALPTDV